MPDFQRIRIVSDGTYFGTLVTTEDGVPIAGVIEVTFTATVNNFTRATIVFDNVLADVTGAVDAG